MDPGYVKWVTKRDLTIIICYMFFKFGRDSSTMSCSPTFKVGRSGGVPRIWFLSVSFHSYTIKLLRRMIQLEKNSSHKKILKTDSPMKLPSWPTLLWQQVNGAYQLTLKLRCKHTYLFLLFALSFSSLRIYSIIKSEIFKSQNDRSLTNY